MKKLMLIPILVTLVIGQSYGLSGGPAWISHQGKVTAGGIAVANGNYSMTFSLFKDSTGGSPLWTETQMVTVTDGLYSVMLGSVSPLGMPIEGSALYIQTTFNGQTMTPRMKLGSVPYSFSAQRINGDIFTSPGNLILKDTLGHKRGGIGITADTVDFRLFQLDDTNLAAIELSSSPGGPRWMMREYVPTGVDEHDVSLSSRGMMFRRGTDTTLSYSDSGFTSLGIGTGHPSEALTVAGVERIIPDWNPIDPWVGARKGIVLAKEGSDAWGRSSADSAGIYLPADVSDFAIISSKASGGKTALRMDVGDDPSDHILLMPSGDVGIKKMNPTVALDVHGVIKSDSGGIQFPNGTIQTTAAGSEGASQAVNSTTPKTVTNTITTILTDTINCPTAGYVLVIGSAQLDVNHVSGAANELLFGLSTDSLSFPADQDKSWIMPSGAASGDYVNIITVEKIFSVTAGSKKFFLLGQRSTGAVNYTAIDIDLSLLFIPTALGNVAQAPMANTGERKPFLADANSSEMVSQVGASFNDSEIKNLKTEVAELSQMLQQVLSDKKKPVSVLTPVNSETKFNPTHGTDK